MEDANAYIKSDDNLRPIEDNEVREIQKDGRFDKLKEVSITCWSKAKIIDKGLLKVYFVPFFGADYNVLYVDDDYQYAVVGGNRKNYLWILSRKDTLEEDIYDKLVKIALERGYDTKSLQKF